MVTQILNFGLPAPLDIQVVGNESRRRTAPLPNRLLNEMKYVPGRRTCAFSSRSTTPSVGRCGPHQGTADGARRSATSPQPADRHQRQLPDLAQLLAEPAERRQLQHRGAGAAVRSRHAAGSAEHPAHRRRRSAGSGTSVRRWRFGQSVATPMGGQPMQILGNVASVTPGRGQGTVATTTSRPVIDIYGNVVNSDLASVDTRSRRSSQRMKGICRAARRSSCADRSRPCAPRSSAWSAGLAFSILSRLSADRRQLPVLARSLHHHLGAAGGAGAGSSGSCSSPTRASASRR